MYAYTIPPVQRGPVDQEILAEAQDLGFRKIPDTFFTEEEYRRIIRRGYEVGDQIFTSDKGGSYNSSLFMRLAESFPEHFDAGKGKLTDELFKYIVANIEIDPVHMASLTPEQLVQPVAVITINDPSPFVVIDGHHRIVRLYMEGYREFFMLVGDRLTTHRCYVAKPRNLGI